MEFFCGQKATFSKTISESDVYAFAGITGDFNDIHINEVAAKESIFGNRVVHGCLVSSFISTVLGMRLPGPGTIYLSQETKYEKPVFIGDTIMAEVEIIQIEKQHARLRTTVRNSNNDVVVSGIAFVKLP